MHKSPMSMRVLPSLSLTLRSAFASILVLAFFMYAPGAGAATTPCTLPGVTVVTDATGDENMTTGIASPSSFDIQSVAIAELGSDTDTLTFTIKVADLSSPPPNGNWYVVFTAPNHTTYFVDMETDPTSTAAYNYGTFDSTTGFSTVGAADGGSFNANGTITIKIATAKVGNVGKDDLLSAINGQTKELVGDPLLGGIVLSVDDTENGGYKLVGNASCAGAPAPTPSATTTPTPAASPSATPATGKAGQPRFFNYVAPAGSGDDSGEPSIGSDWQTEKKFTNSLFQIPNGGTALYFGGFAPYMLKITFDDCSSPADALWEQKPLLLASTPRAAGDPILFTDSITGRTFVSQLEGLTPAGSTTDITDDDGDTFIPSEGSSLPSDIDHQTFGGGPYAPPLLDVNPVYPHAVYYASQSVADARAARSDDGGLTFGPASPMYTIAECAGLHGHIKVTPDTPATRKNGTVGVVYVPQKACGGSLPFHDGGDASVIVSEDNGTTWTVRSVPNAPTKVDDDPSVGIGSDGTIYLGWQSADGHPRIAVSHDKGQTWSKPVDVGQFVINGGHVLNTVFPEVTAGDPDRAAFAFYGSETGGDNYDCGEGGGCSEPDFPGVWYLYVASTFDGGKTWTTQNVTPNDPVQRGGVCDSGTCRNLLDFFDIQMDKEGRVLVGWDDGCVGACVQGPPNSFSTKATITRQAGGKRLLAAFDPKEPALPGAPQLRAAIDAAKTAVSLNWQTPDSGGAPITAYRVFRRAGTTGNYTLIATVKETNYTDRTFDPAATNYYHVSAVNKVGEGPFCHDVKAEELAVVTPCTLPGVLVVSDLNPDGSDNDGGQNTPPDPSVNIRQIFIAEPDLGPAAKDALIFTMNVGPNGTVAPNSGWYIVWNRLKPDADDDRLYVAMRSDATGALHFEYGKFGVALDTSGNPPNPNSNVPNRVGDADAGSYNPTTGVITIRISRSKINKIDTLQVGTPMNGVNGRTFYGDDADGAPHNQAAASDITNDGAYVIAGNDSCTVGANHPPIASLSANPTSGYPPLKVHFNAKQSKDPDVGDSVASYTFNFGDGSEEETRNIPTIDHTYTHGGAFFATCRVKDSHGVVSSNVASVTIKTSATLLNISTREYVRTGDDVAIGGFIIRGNGKKPVLLRAVGPSLAVDGKPVPQRMKNPTLDLYNEKGEKIASNDDWKDGGHEAEIKATGLAPKNAKESAILKTLAPGEYTAILRGKDKTTGIALVEAYDLDTSIASQLANISSRGFVARNNNVMIGGFVAGAATAAPAQVVIRAIGPSMKDVPDRLEDPTLDVFNQNGGKIASNDNWEEGGQQAALVKTGLEPKDPRESAVLLKSLEPGHYTAIVRGKNDTTGNALVEVFNLHAPQ